MLLSCHRFKSAVCERKCLAPTLLFAGFFRRMISRLPLFFARLLAYVLALFAAHSAFAVTFHPVSQIDGTGPGFFYGASDGFKFFVVDTHAGDVVTLSAEVTGKTSSAAQSWLLAGYAADGVVDIGDWMFNGDILGVGGVFDEGVPTNTLTYSFTSLQDSQWAVQFVDYEQAYSGRPSFYSLTIAVNGYVPVSEEASVLPLVGAGLGLAVLGRRLRARA